jgi:hypothetical protein
MVVEVILDYNAGNRLAGRHAEVVLGLVPGTDAEAPPFVVLPKVEESTSTINR